MKVIDRQRTIEIPDDDPVVDKIRALLFQTEAPVSAPLAALWGEVGTHVREVLVLLAERRDIAQTDLEAELGIDGVGLRGRNAALARVAKKLGVDYPIHQTGGRREHRRFSLDQATAESVLELARPQGLTSVKKH